MSDQTGWREARMMEGVAGLGGRNALSSEVDLRLGLEHSAMCFPDWIGALVELLRRFRRARPRLHRLSIARFEAHWIGRVVAPRGKSVLSLLRRDSNDFASR